MPTQPSDPTSEIANRLTKGFRTIGIVFIVLGLLAVAIPNVATVVIEQLIAWLLVIWGIAGVVYAFGFKQFEEWSIVALCFGVVLVAGLAFVIFPGSGASFLTAVLVAVFLMEGALSILLGLRMSGQIGNWRWIIFSGICAFVLGLIILFQWPTSKQWVLGFLVGLNFLTTGLSLLIISRATDKKANG